MPEELTNLVLLCNWLTDGRFVPWGFPKQNNLKDLGLGTYYYENE